MATNIFLSYGCVVSIMFDFNSANSVITLSFDEKGEKAKLETSNYILDEYIHNKQEDGGLANGCRQKIGDKYSSQKRYGRHQKVVEEYTTKSFLFTKGIFSESMFFYQFKNLVDLQLNYRNSLFLVLPAGEYECKQKIKKSIKELRGYSREEYYREVCYNKYTDIYLKYKQEVLTNHEMARSMLSRKELINFDDNVQFMHIASGKFLKFKKQKDDLKIYLKLTSQTCAHTIFRIRPGFNYQTENSTNVYFELGIKIACGDKPSNREKYLANSRVLQSGYLLSSIGYSAGISTSPRREREKEGEMKLIRCETMRNPRLVNIEHNSSEVEIIKTVDSVKRKHFSNLNNNIYNLLNSRQFNRKLLKSKRCDTVSSTIVADDKSFHQWKIIKFSNDFQEDQIYLNSLDMFWIENCEKDVYVSPLNEEKIQKEKDRERTEKDFLLRGITAKGNVGHMNLMLNNLNNGLANTNEATNDSMSLLHSPTNCISATSKPPDKEEKFPIIKKDQSGLKTNLTFEPNKNMITNMNTSYRENFTFINNPQVPSSNAQGIPLNFFSTEESSRNSSSSSIVTVGLKFLQVNEFKDPLGIFCFEQVPSGFQKCIQSSDGILPLELPPVIGPFRFKSEFRIRNIVTNKIVCITASSNAHGEVNQCQFLKMINYSEIINDPIKSEETLFLIEPVYKGDNTSANFEDMMMSSQPYVKKTDNIRIRSKKYNSYLAVRQFRNENKAMLLLTKNLSDLTIFRMDYLTEEDKISFHFFEQLNLALEYLLEYFDKSANKGDVTVLYENEENCKQEKDDYEKIFHIFSILKNSLIEYKAKKACVGVEDTHKMDVMKNIREFEIIEKMMQIFHIMWFKNNSSANNLGNGMIANNMTNITELHQITDFRNLSEGIISDRMYWKKNITDIVLKTIKLTYDIDPTIIISIQGHLHHIFKFVGKINSTTKFLSHILRNNNSLLLKFLSGVNGPKDSVDDNIVSELRESIRQIINEYNSSEGEINFSVESLSLFFELLNIMLICNDEPFRPFYSEIFKGLHLLREEILENGEKILVPNIHVHYILCDFFLVGSMIHFKKKFVLREETTSKKSECNCNNNSQPSHSHTESSQQKEEEQNLIIHDDSIAEFEISLDNYDSNKCGVDKESLFRIISLNILLYSNLGLHDERFKAYLSKTFTIEIVNGYLSDNVKEINGESKINKLPEDIKCALIRMINYLYLKKHEEILKNLNLCRKLTSQDDSPNLESREKEKQKQKEKESKRISFSGIKDASNIVNAEEIKKIISHIEAKLIQHINKKKILTTSFLLHVIESCQYIIRHVFSSNSSDEKKEIIFKFMSLLLIVYENFVGVTAHLDINRSLLMRSSNKGWINEENKDLLFNLLQTDKLQFIAQSSGTGGTQGTYVNALNGPFTKLFELLKKKYLTTLLLFEKSRSEKGDTSNQLKINNSIKEKSWQINSLNLFSRNNTLDFRGILNNNRTNNDTLLNQSMLFATHNHGLNYTKKEVNSKAEKKEFLKRICNIFIEFLRYIEYEYVNQIESNLLQLKDDKIDDEDKSEVICDKIFTFHREKRNILFMTLMDQFALYHLENKKDLGNANILSDKKGNTVLPKSEEFRITNIFFESLQKLESLDMKLIIFEILFRMNSQYMIFFDNISNLVILSNANDLAKFDVIKQVFISLSIIISNLYSTNILDGAIRIQIENFQKELDGLLDLLFDRNKWLIECEDLEIQEKKETEADESISQIFEEKDKSNDDNSGVLMNDHQQPKQTPDIAARRSCRRGVTLLNRRSTQYEIPNLPKFGKSSINVKKEFFLEDFSEERVNLLQHILKNLGLNEIVIKFMEKANELVCRYMDYLLIIKGDNDISIKNATLKNINVTHLQLSVQLIQLALDDIYKLLALFIKRNRKHQLLIEEDIEIIFTPVYLKNQLDKKVMISLSSFILEFIRHFQVNEFHNSESFIRMMSMLVNDYQWQENKELIPFWVEILKLIIKSSLAENIDMLIICLNNIKSSLIDEINQNTYTPNDLISLREILKLIFFLKTIPFEDCDNKVKNLLSINDIVNKIFETLKFENKERIPFEIINLTVDFFFENTNLYKEELQSTKRIQWKLVTTLAHFNKDFRSTYGSKLLYVKDDTNIHSNTNQSKAQSPDSHEMLLQLNIFLGSSIPKLNIIFNEVPRMDNRPVKDDFAAMIFHSNELYQQLYDLIKDETDPTEQKKYFTEKTFLCLVDPKDLKTIRDKFPINLQKLSDLLKLDAIEKFIMNEDQQNDIEGRRAKVSIVLNNSSNLNKNLHKIHQRRFMNQISLKSNDDGRSIHCDPDSRFAAFWNDIREILNNPNFQSGVRFHQLANVMINKERETCIKYMVKYVKRSEDTSKVSIEEYAHMESTKTVQDNQKISSSGSSSSLANNTLLKFRFLKILHNLFSEYVDKNTKTKEHLYFYFWLLIHFMRYDIEKEKFTEKLAKSDPNNPAVTSYSSTPLNKDIISDIKFINLTSKLISLKNLKCIDYDIVIIIKFYNNYLNGLDDYYKSKFYDYLINNSKSEKLFLLMKNILDNFKQKLRKDHEASASEQSKENGNFFNMTMLNPNSKISSRKRIKKNELESSIFAKYENIIDPYEEIVQLISYLVENNLVVKNQMKDYLRYQYNSPKSLNFISLLAMILEFFVLVSEKDLTSTLRTEYTFGVNTALAKRIYLSEDRRKFISSYYPTIIKIIESLTKCCQGPSFENQNSLVNDTHILEFMSNILFKLSYRMKDSGKDGGKDCLSLGLSRKKLSFLKYKLLVLLSVLTMGRKRGDKIYEKITKTITLHALSGVMTETLKEIMIEKDVEDLSKLVLVDDLYLRFEKYNYRDSDPSIMAEENKKFIIYENGTYIYIILNIYYENMNRSKAEEYFKIIRDLKKKHTSEKKKTKTTFFLKSILTNTLSFIKSFINLIVQIFRVIFLCSCFFKKKPRDVYEDILIHEKETGKDSNSSKSTYDSSFFKAAYDFYFKYTPSIEVIFNGNVSGYYVKLFPMCMYLTPEMKQEFEKSVDRSNTKSKLASLFKNVCYFKEALEFNQKLEEFFKKVLILDLILNQYLFFMDLSFFITLCINFLIITSYFKVGSATPSRYDYAFLYNPSYLEQTKSTLYVLSLIQVILSGLIFLNYFIKNLPKYTYLDRHKTQGTPYAQRNSQALKRVGLFFTRIACDYNLLYHIVYLVFSLLGFFHKSYFFFSFLLFEMVRRSTTLTNLLLAIWNPRKQLIVTLILFYLFEYFFTILIYIYLASNLPSTECYQMDRCLFTIFDQTFKNSNGIINYLDFEVVKKELYMGLRFWLDNFFSIIQIMLILQMVAGIIIDNFSALRERQGKIHEDQFNVCFICGLHRNDLNKLYGNEEGYHEHIMMDHYYWNYLFLIFNLIRKDRKELTGLDEYIYKNYVDNQSHAWIPLGTCKKKIDGESKIVEEKAAQS